MNQKALPNWAVSVGDAYSPTKVQHARQGLGFSFIKLSGLYHLPCAVRNRDSSI